jgi:ribosomal protein L18E
VCTCFEDKNDREKLDIFLPVCTWLENKIVVVVGPVVTGGGKMTLKVQHVTPKFSPVLRHVRLKFSVRATPKVFCCGCFKSPI